MARDDISGLVDEALGRYPNVPRDVAHRLVNVESGGNAAARSAKGAVGVMQLMPDTARELGLRVDSEVDDRLDPRKNIDAGLRYLSRNIERFGGDINRGVAAYHAGPGAVERAGGIPNTSDGITTTRQYTDAIAGNAPRTRRFDASQAAPTEKRAAKYKPGDVMAAEDILSLPIDYSPKAEDRPTSIWSSIGNRLGYGVNTLGEDMRTVVGMVLGEGVTDAIDRFGKWVGMADLDARKEALDAALPEDWKESMGKKWVEDDGSFGPAWADWKSWTGALAESIPGTVATMVPAIKLGTGAATIAKAKVLQEAARRGTISRAAAEKVADRVGGEIMARTAMVAGSVLEGIQGGAQSAREVSDYIAKLPDDVLEQSEAFQTLVGENGGDRVSAREQLRLDAKTQAFVTAGAITGLFGGAGDRLLAKGLTSGIKGNLGTRILKGAVSEGLLEEAPQSAGSTWAENIAKGKADPSVDPMAGVANAAAGGAAVGGLMGAGFGAVSREERSSGIPGGAPARRGRKFTPPTPGGYVSGSVAEGEGGSPGGSPPGPRAENQVPDDLRVLRRFRTDDENAMRDRSGGPPAPPEPPEGGTPAPPEPQEPTDAEVARRLAQAAKMEDGDLGRPSDNAPYAARQAAVMALGKRKLKDTHDVVELGPDAFVLRPKSAEEAPAGPVAESQAPAASGPGDGGVAPAPVPQEPASVATTTQPPPPAAAGEKPPLPIPAQVPAVNPPALEGEFQPASGSVFEMGAKAAEAVNARTPPAGLSRGDQVEWLRGYDSVMLPTIPPRDSEEGPAITVDVKGPPQAPVRPPPAIEKAAIDAAAHKAATSPKNDLPQPTQAQKEAGNYQKGHLSLHGLDIAIENPKGSERSGTDKDGKKWSVKMPAHYGYIKGTVGKDKDHVDVYLGPFAEDPAAPVFVIDQRNKEGGFDEHKVFIGWGRLKDVEDTYRKAFTSAALADRLMDNGNAIHRTTLEEFKAWLKDGNTKREFGKREAPVPSSAADERPGSTTSKPVGKNHKGVQIFEDDKGVRFYVENGVRVYEKVAMAPSRDGMKVSVNHSGDFLTTGEHFEALAHQREEKPGDKDTTPAAESDAQGESKWKGLTLWGKSAILKAIGSKKGPGVLWNYLDTAEKEAALKQIPNVDALVKAMADLDEKERVAVEIPTAKPAYGASNTVFTADDAAAARELLRKKLGQVNAGIDPELMRAGVTLAGYHIEAGSRAFADFAKAMVADLGEIVRPYLRSWYEAVRYHPGFDARGMTPAGEIGVEEQPAPATTAAPQQTPDLKGGQSGATMGEGGSDGTNPEQFPSGRDRPPGDAGAGSGDVLRTPGGGRTRGSGGRSGQGVRRTDGRRDEPGTGPDLFDARPEQDRGRDQDRGREPAGGQRSGSVASPRIPGKRRPSLPDGVADYHPAPGAIERKGSWLEQAKTNLDIIELVKKLETENRHATPAEQEVLSKWTGWGASEIAQGLFNGYTRHDGTFEFNEYSAQPGWKALMGRAKALLTQDEIAAARRSTQYAHYTSEPVVRGIWKAVERLGFKGGKILEPGMGTGLFPVLADKMLFDNSSYTGIEYEPFTAKIAKYLLPEQTVRQGDYTTMRVPSGFFDLAIGNPPFARTKVLVDPEYKAQRFSLHDYFFAKTIDRVRPGGLMAFVTSRYSMDKANDAARRYLAERADLVAGIRLPRTAFLKNAGTEVVTDILIFQRRAPGQEPNGVKWTGLEEITTPEGEKYRINEYFAANPNNVLGAHSNKGKMRAGNEYTVLPADGDLGEQIAAVVAKLPQNIVTESALKTEAETPAFERDMSPKAQKEGQLYVGDDGEVYRRDYGVGRRVEEIGKGSTAWFKSYVGLRDAIKTARYDQLTDGDWKASLKELNRVYDAFIKEHGHILSFSETERVERDEDGEERTVVIRRHVNSAKLQVDVEGPLVAALEMIDSEGKIVRGPFLKDRVLAKPEPPSIKTTQDALAVSLSDRGRLDLPHIASLLGKEVDEVISDLGDAIYYAPEGEWQTSDEYLSGNVRAKLEEAKLAADSDTAYERNVQALLKVQPLPLGAADITVGLGSPWVPAEYISQFASEVLGIQHANVSFHELTGTWGGLDGPGSQRGRSAGAEWATESRSPAELLDAALNAKTIKVTYSVKDGDSTKTYTDEEKTAAANEKVRKIKEEYGRWVWRDAKRAADLLQIYNDKYNNLAPRHFSGDHLRLPGLSLRYKLFDHQKRAIWRQIATGDTYLAHAVGAGKTLEMIVGGMEQRRLGLIRTPMYVVPNHMLQQFSSEFIDAYPAADIMVADEQNFDKANRQRFVAQAAMNKPDAIIITHSAFGKIKPDQKFANSVLDRIKQEFEAAIDDLESDKTPAARRTRKQIEQRLEQMEQRFGAKTGGGDDVLTLNEMGVDFLYVDEAHEFRKLDFFTNRTNVKGITPEGSRRALDLYIKVKSLDAARPGRSHVFASGTPITNTLAELYSIQRFMDERALEEDGMRAFDSWASQFGEVQSYDERNAAGTYEVVERFASFVNLPELMSRVRSYMDVLTSSQLKHLVKVPEMSGGGPQVILSPPSRALKGYMEQLAKRIEKSRKWKPSPDEPGNPDPLINIITDARLAAIDMGFVTGTSDPKSKLNEMIDRIISTGKASDRNVYHDRVTGKDDQVKGSTQIVFSAVGFGEAVSASRGFDVRGHINKRLIAGGFKPDQIAWIADYNTHAKKEHLFRSMREGKVRVLFGSPKNMGTGVNVQKRLIAEHYLAPPWYPADEEQPRGRIVRQGNQNEKVDVLWYATKETYDSTQWQMIARKSRFIEAAMTGSRDVRKVEDVSEASQYEQASALASGDERVIKYTRLRRDIENLERLQRAHADEQFSLQGKLRNERSRVHSLTERRDKLQKLIAAGAGQYITSSSIDGTIRGTRVRGSKELGEAVVSEIKRVAAVSPPGEKEVRTIEFGKLNGADLLGRMRVRNIGEEKKKEHYVELYLRFGDLNADSMTKYVYAEEDLSSAQIVSVGSEVAGMHYAVEQEKDRVELEIEKTKKDIATGEQRFGVPFDRAAELVEKIAEAALLRKELLVTNVEPVDEVEAMAEAIAAGRWEGEGGRQAPSSGSSVDLADIDRDPGSTAGSSPPSGWTAAETSTPESSRIAAQAGEVLKDETSKADAEALRAAIEDALRRRSPNARVPADAIEVVALRDAPILDRIGKAFGKRVVGFKVNDPKLRFFGGATNINGRDGTIYILADNPRPHLAILGHELVHNLKRDNPALYAQFSRSIRPYLVSQWRRHSADARAWSGHTEEKALEELMADLVGDGFVRRDFWERIGKQSPTLLQRVFAAVKVLIDKAFKALGRRPPSSRSREFLLDYHAALRIAADVIAQYESGQGTTGSAQPALASTSGPLWRSALLDAMQKAPWSKAGEIETAQFGRWLDARAKEGSFKPDELEWSGLKDYIATQGPKVTRSQVVEYLSQNGVRVEETILGGGAESSWNAVEAAKTELRGFGWTAEIDSHDGGIVSIEHDNGTTLYVTGYGEEDFETEDEEPAGRDVLSDAARAAAVRLGRALNDSLMQENGDGGGYSEYVLPGGENYRELLLTLPGQKAEEREVERLEQIVRDTARAEAAYRDAHPTAVPARDGDLAKLVVARDQAGIDLSNARAGRGPRFTSSHFDQPNILAHVRFNERTDADGKRVLFVEEIQSDWAQKGRRDGFRGESDNFKVRQDTDGTWIAADEGDSGESGFATREEAQAWADRENRNDSIAVQRAPFVGKTDSWVALALKRMIRYAADGGFDAIAWTTGEQQAERYDLSKHIDGIDVYDLGHDQYDVKLRPFGERVYRSAGRVASGESELADIIGKELASKAVKELSGRSKIDRSPASFSGLDLKVGGEGMRTFYDKIVPGVARDVLKKLGGGQVEAIDLSPSAVAPSNDDLVRTGQWIAPNAPQRGGPMTGQQPGIRLTDAMRARAAEGMPMFSALEPADWTPNALNAREIGRKVNNRIRDALAPSLNRFNWWLKTVGTQYHKAVLEPFFRPVFRRAQRFIEDVTMFSRDPAERAKNLLPPMESFRDVVSDITGKSAPVADVDAVARAMFEGTLENRREAPASLTPKQRALFDEARGAIDRSLDILAASTAANMVRKVRGFDRKTIAQGKETPEEAAGIYEAEADRLRDKWQRIYDKVNALKLRQLTAVEKGLKTSLAGLSKGHVSERAALEERAADDRQAIIDRFDEALASVKRRVDLAEQTKANLAAVFKRAAKLKADGYAPLMRFGRYTVTFRDGEDRVVWFSMHETQHQARETARRMAGVLGDGAYPSLETMSQEKWKLYQGISPDALALFADVAGLANDELMQAYLQTVVANRSALKRMIHRKGTPGYDGDLRRVLSSFLLSNARLASRNYHMGELLDAVASIPEGRGDVVDEAVKLVRYVQNPEEEAGPLRGFLFINFLGGSVASALVNMTQPITMTLPYLAQFGGASAASSRLAAGMAVAVGKRRPGAELAKALHRAAEEGITAPHEIHQLQAEASQNFGSNIWLRRGIKAWGMMFSLAEQFNRKATFAAAFEIAQAMAPGDLERAGFRSAYDFAERAVHDTQGIYSRANRPNWARGTIGATVMTFKQFSIAYLEFLVRLPPKQRALALAILILAAGLQGLPFAEDIEDMIDTLGQSLGYRTNSKRALRELAVSILGADLGKMLTHGASGIPGVPLDVSARLGLGNLIPGTALAKRSGSSAGDVAEILGPFGGLARAAGGAVSALLSGDVGAAAKGMAPVAIQNAMKAADMWQTGMYRDFKGRKVIDTTGSEAALKMLGLQPSSVADVQRSAREAQQDVNLVRAVEDEIASLWAEGRFEKDQEKVDRAKGKLRDWNEKNPEFRIKIDAQQINKRVKAMGTERAARLIKAAPREVRGAVAESMR